MADPAPKSEPTTEAAPAEAAPAEAAPASGANADGQTVKTLVLTWNVGNAPPPNDISDMIPVNGGDNDIVACGLQECSYKDHKESKALKTFGYHNGKTQSVHNFFGTVAAQLGDEWEIIESPKAWEMLLVVFVRKSYHDQISQVGFKKENTGIGGVVANKGGLVVRFMFGGTSLAFVSCHLEAHEGASHRNKRNASCEEVLDGAKVEFMKADVLAHTDHVIWMGDLNYRLDLSIGDPSLKDKLKKMTKKEEIAAFQFGLVIDKINKQEWAELWKNDELSKDINDGKVFHGFKEAQCMEGHLYQFAPTFKVKVGPDKILPDMNEYYNHERTPSWCDRILWRSMPALTQNIKQLSLEGLSCVPTSDHKPVRSVFEIDLHPKLAKPVERNQCPKIVITNLKGKALKACDSAIKGGKSDPYILFRGPGWLDHADCKVGDLQATLGIDKELNPEWKDDMVPILTTVCNDKATLARQHLQVILMDEDTDGPDDNMGYIAVPISQNLIDGKTEEFNQDVTCAGVHYGGLSGSIRMVWPSDEEYVTLKRELKHSGGCCTIL